MAVFTNVLLRIAHAIAQSGAQRVVRIRPRLLLSRVPCQQCMPRNHYLYHHHCIERPDMFVHAVYFWLRSDIAASDRDTFIAWLSKLTALPSVRQGYVGVPAATDRPVIERGYSYALVLLFDNAAGEEAYQVHPDHDRFRVECRTFWTQIRIFDSVSPPSA